MSHETNVLIDDILRKQMLQDVKGKYEKIIF